MYLRNYIVKLLFSFYICNFILNNNFAILRQLQVKCFYREEDVFFLQGAEENTGNVETAALNGVLVN